MTNPSDLIKRFVQERRAVEGKATPGPWECRPDIAKARVSRFGNLHGNGDVYADIPTNPNADRDFVCDARTSVPLLLKCVEEMAGALENIIESDNNRATYTRGPFIARDALSRAAEILDGKT